MKNNYYGFRTNDRAKDHIVKRMKELQLETQTQYFLFLLELDGYTIKPSDV